MMSANQPKLKKLHKLTNKTSEDEKWDPAARFRQKEATNKRIQKSTDKLNEAEDAHIDADSFLPAYRRKKAANIGGLVVDLTSDSEDDNDSFVVSDGHISYEDDSDSDSEESSDDEGSTKGDNELTREEDGSG